MSDNAVKSLKPHRLDLFVCAAANRSRLDDDVAVLDVNRKRLCHVRPLGQRFAVLDYHRIGPHLDAVRIEPGLPVAHVEFPPVPGTTQQFADSGSPIDAGLRRGQTRDAGGLIEWRTRVRAAIEQRKELTVDMEYHDV